MELTRDSVEYRSGEHTEASLVGAWRGRSMTTITVSPVTNRSRYGLRQACRAERAKLFSIRSTW